LIAKTGAEGVNLAENHRPDILLLDVELPDMDGFAVLDQLNERMGATAPPVVIVTADATEATRRRATSPLIREFITKPYEISVIARICREVSEDREAEAR
jgi:CheY-like chemotaxis protein